ncbi:MAG: hypothetical protein KatS3mg077_2486 [Candidatus Binatia bacterium]|nr:MAG: hypothetical protein KatS3mg077_2486 [Candidatus Binatia bacterium]
MAWNVEPPPRQSQATPAAYAPYDASPSAVTAPRTTADRSGLDSAKAVQWDSMLSESTKVLVVAPHPDDETLAAAGLIQRALARRAPIRIVYVTNGDGYFEAVAAQLKERTPSAEDFRRYGRQRQAEAAEAQLALGVPASWLTFLGFPDGGLAALWGPYWCALEPYVSPFTELSQTLSQPALQYRGVELERRLLRILTEWQPGVVVVPDPRDTHPDHCTAGLFMLAAVRAAREKGAIPPPIVLGYLVHFPGYPGEPSWSDQAAASGTCGARQGRPLLAGSGWISVRLENEQVAAKQEALGRYASQVRVMRPFFQQFVRNEEWFSRLDPSVNGLSLSHPPCNR